MPSVSLKAAKAHLRMPVVRVVDSKNKVQHRFVGTGMIIQVWLHKNTRTIGKRMLHMWHVVQDAPELFSIVGPNRHEGCTRACKAALLVTLGQC